MRISEDGNVHPTGSDPFEPEGMFHIGNCAECREQFPIVARMDDKSRTDNPGEYAEMRDKVEGRY